MTGAPPRDVLAAFGARGEPRRLPGGQVTSWVVGGLVLKAGGKASFQEWLGTTVGELPQRGFRLAEAVRTSDGEWVRDGWSATCWVAGAVPDHRREPRWEQIVEGGRAFHRATAQLPKPDFLDRRTDWWAAADRHAWSDEAPHVIAQLAAVADRLRAAAAPLGELQLVHGDLTSNVLFAAGLPPAIIDLSPYWRPPAYTEGIVVADALCWYDAPASLPARCGVSREAVARGLLFRVLTTNARVLDGVGRESVGNEADRYERAADLIGL